MQNNENLDDILRDKDGYLKQHQDWNQSVAVLLAKEEGLVLTSEHWIIINTLRNFYLDYNRSLSVRPLIRLCKHEIGEDKISSLYLQKLFPKGVAKQANKIAGLPKPKRCI